MSKLVILAIDGLDSIQLDILEEFLPNFTKLKNLNPKVKMTSIFPPDSVPAWGSIYTGLNPAEHGIINFMDPNNDEFKIIFNKIHEFYEGHTFWDKLSEQGKKVCILLPFSIYPPWPVNGVMVCRSLDVVNEDFPLKTYPEEVYEQFDLSEINANLFHGFPSKRNLDKFLESMERRTENETKLGLKFLKEFESDLHFIYFSSMDAVQHTFWNYYDEKHPDYSGDSNYKSVIKDFYIHYDNILGKYLSLIDEDTTLMVISDHGHGMRPVHLVNINEILRLKGLLHPIEQKIVQNPFNHKEKIKKLLSSAVSVIGIGNSTLKLLSKFPIWKKMLASPSYIDFNKTRAYVSSLSAVKSYSQGGIIINRNVVGSEYESVINEVIEALREIPDESGERNLMKWICRREDVYNGEYIDRYPDILFELDTDYGVGWAINDSIFGKSSMSNFQPGSHLKDSPVLLFSKDIGFKTCANCSLMDISTIISSFFNKKVD